MVYLLWSLLNIGLLLFFVFVCIRATKLMWTQMGPFASIVFVAGLLSFISNSNDHRVSKLVKPQTKTWVSPLTDSLNVGSFNRHLSLEKTIGLDFDLIILYGRHIITNREMPAIAISTMTGLLSGLTWQPTMINIQHTDNPTAYAYRVKGILYWKLLRSTVYTEQKIYKGVIEKP